MKIFKYKGNIKEKSKCVEKKFLLLSIIHNEKLIMNHSISYGEMKDFSDKLKIVLKGDLIFLIYLHFFQFTSLISLPCSKRDKTSSDKDNKFLDMQFVCCCNEKKNLWNIIFTGST